LFIVKNNWLTENGNLSKTRQFLPETGTEMNSFIIKHSIVLIVIIIEKNSDFPYKYLYFDKSKVLKDKDVLLVLASGFKEEKIIQNNKSRYELISGEIYNVRVKGASIVNIKLRSFDPNLQVLYVVDDVIVSDISYLAPDYVNAVEFINDVGAQMYE